MYPDPATSPAVMASFVAPPKLNVEELEQLCKVRQIDPEVDLAYDLVQQFAQLLRIRTGEHLDAWLNKVESSKLSSVAKTRPSCVLGRAIALSRAGRASVMTSVQGEQRGCASIRKGLLHCSYLAEHS
jgi:hypothetical protein